jgi:uncharacterized protein (DUF2252 family)
MRTPTELPPFAAGPMARAVLPPPSQRTPHERAALGRAARRHRPRSSAGSWQPSPDRADPVDILEHQARTRVVDLVPIRYGRMSASPFAFFRGAAAVMAADLGSHATSGLRVQLCGDAHLANFGGFAAPDRRVIFDINDFDESHPGPFEWDLQRLGASLEIASRELGLDDGRRGAVVRRAARRYRSTMADFAAMTDLDVWYLRLNAETMQALFGPEVHRKVMRHLERSIDATKAKDRFKALDRLTHQVDGRLRFVSDPPLLVPADEVFAGVDGRWLYEALLGLLRSYRRSLPPAGKRLADSYRFVDMARKVVGVGSVGTRCWVVLMTGRDEGDPLILQVKEAESSVLEPFVGSSAFTNHGQRVVVGQRLMQAAGDVFLGWDRGSGADGVTRDFYVRQLWDWKASADVATMTPAVLAVYGEMCAWSLARAHARTGDRIAIAAYLGTSDTFDRALARFAAGYADQNEKDHQRLVEAISSGRVDALRGV